MIYYKDDNGVGVDNNAASNKDYGDKSYQSSISYMKKRRR